MTKSEALALGYCPHCASYSEPSGGALGRWWCGVDDECHLSPQYGEWLRVAFGLKGPKLAEDLGVFEGLKPRNKN